MYLPSRNSVINVFYAPYFMLKVYSDSEMVEGCRKGSAQMQRRVYDTFSPRMYGLCLRYIREDFEAEEIMINGFMKVFTKIEQFKSEGSFEGWIRRIMVNECLNYLRKKKWMYAEVDIENVSDSIEHSSYESDLDTEELMGLIDELPTGYRTVFNLYAIEGYSHKEVAKMLNISENTSKSQLSRARALLQKSVERGKKKLNKICNG